MTYGSRIIDDLKEGLARFLSAHGKTVREIIGMSIGTVKDLEEIPRDEVIYPRFKREKCLKCGRCYLSCRDGGHQALAIGEDGKPVLNPKRCVGCHLCTLVCPAFAIESSQIS